MILLHKYVPAIIPKAIGVKNKTLFLGLLKILQMVLIQSSYKFKTIKRPLPERPGAILKIPTKKPLKKFFMINFM